MPMQTTKLLHKRNKLQSSKKNFRTFNPFFQHNEKAPPSISSALFATGRSRYGIVFHPCMGRVDGCGMGTIIGILILLSLWWQDGRCRCSHQFCRGVTAFHGHYPHVHHWLLRPQTRTSKFFYKALKINLNPSL